MRRSQFALTDLFEQQFEDEAFEDEEELEEIDRRTRPYVSWLQQSLNRILGAQLTVDGVIGPRTRAAVRSFQQRQGLTVDGVAGPQIDAALVKAGAGPPPAAPVGSRGGNAPAAPVDTVLPRSGPGFYSYHPSSPGRQYGTADTIRALASIGRVWAAARPNGPRIGIGDISFRGGGPMSPHVSHQKGIDADIRLMRKDGREKGVTFRDASYSRPLTQQLVDAIRANGVVGVEFVLFNDAAVRGVKWTKGHDNHLHVRFLQAPSTGASRAPTALPSRTPAKPTIALPRAPVAPINPGADRDVAAAMRRWTMPTGLITAPLFHQLVDRHRPQHLPLPLLVAFSSLEASGWNDATHGTEGNRWTSPKFYELGVFQVPAGLHGTCTSGHPKDCERQPPGDDPHRASAWFKICDQLKLDPLKWTDPITQVRVGIRNLETDAATVLQKHPRLFPNLGSDWYLRAAVLLPFGPGIGYTLNLLKRHAAELEGLPESARWPFLRARRAKTDNVDEKMTRAQKLAAALGMSSAMPRTS